MVENIVRLSGIHLMKLSQSISVNKVVHYYPEKLNKTEH